MAPRNGVYNRDQLTRFKNLTTTKSIVTGVDPDTTAFIPGRAGYTIMVTRVFLAVTTDNAATITLQDDATTPVVICRSKASPGVGPLPLLEAPDGVPCTEGKNLDLVGSAAGLGGQLYVEAYLVPTGVLQPAGI